MRFSLPILRRVSEAFRKRDWFGIGFELFVVVLGVILGVQASRWSAAREDREYRQQIVVSLDTTLSDYAYEGRRIHDRITASLAEYRRRAEAGERPPPPMIVFPGLERPPTRAWEAMVETGVARSIEPPLMFRLAVLFDMADSWGDKYQRYNAFTEQRIVPFKSNPTHFYGTDGTLKPEYVGHVELLHDLLKLTDQMTERSSSLRRMLRSRKVEDTVELKDLPIES